MKSKLQPEKAKPNAYPNLYVDKTDNSVFLITAPGYGTCVNSGQSVIPVGRNYGGNLMKFGWTPFTGTVTLEN